MITTITRKFTFNMAHRVPNHKSKCRNLHGHTYKLLITFLGSLIDEEGNSSEGMVFDFSDVKSLVGEFIDDQMDHAFMGMKNSEEELFTLCLNNNWKLTVVKFPPTVENIAKYIFDEVNKKINRAMDINMFPMPDDLKVSKVELWETPNCYATYSE